MKLTCTEEMDPYNFEDVEGPLSEKPKSVNGEPKESSPEPAAEGTSPEEKGSIKMPVILRPKHRKWIENQDFGLSEWVRENIDRKIEGENGNGGDEHQSRGGSGPSSEKEKKNSDPSDHACDECGEREAKTKITENGQDRWLCRKCQEDETGGESHKEVSPGSDSGSNPTCEMCEMSEAVKQVPMGSGRSKMWLCETCMQEEGFRQAQRQ